MRLLSILIVFSLAADCLRAGAAEARQPPPDAVTLDAACAYGLMLSYYYAADCFIFDTLLILITPYIIIRWLLLLRY